MLYVYSIKQYLVNDKKKGSIIMQKHKTIMQTFAVTLSAVMLFGTAANAETMKLTGKGFTDIKGTDAERNSNVTIEIISDKINISDDGVWSGFTDNGENTAFMGTVRADENGAYEFNIFLTESGKYIVRTGNSGFKAVKEDSLWFTNEDSLKQRLGEIKTAAQADDTDKIKEILENNRYDIKIFSSIGNDADYEKAASILGEYIKKNQSALTEETIGILGEKACVLSVLSDNTFKGFGEYSDGFGAEDLKAYEFYKDSFADEFTKMMKADNPKGIDEYNSAVEKNMILCLVKYGDSSGELKDCLTLYADEIGVDGSKITADMCKSLMNEKDINGYSDINAAFISVGVDNSAAFGEAYRIAVVIYAILCCERRKAAYVVKYRHGVFVQPVGVVDVGYNGVAVHADNRTALHRSAVEEEYAPLRVRIAVGAVIDIVNIILVRRAYHRPLFRAVLPVEKLRAVAVGRVFPI